MKKIIVVFTAIATATISYAALPQEVFSTLEKNIQEAVTFSNPERARVLAETYAALRRADLDEQSTALVKAQTTEVRAKTMWLGRAEVILACLPDMVKAARDEACPEGKDISSKKYNDGLYQVLTAVSRAYAFIASPNKEEGVKAVRETVQDFKKVDDANRKYRRP